MQRSVSLIHSGVLTELADGRPILNLPARVVDVVDCPFDSEERAFYQALEQQTALTFNKVSP